MKEIKKARMGMIAILALMLVSITRRLPEARRFSSGITTLTLAGIVLLVAAGSVSANGACIGDNYEFGPGDTVNESCTLNDTMVCTGSGLIVGADGITIDGNNFGITGSNAAWSYGIHNYDWGLYRGYHNVIIKNLDISGFQEGICIQGTSSGPNTARVENNTIYNCTVHDNGANTAELSSGCGIHFYQNVWNSTIDNCRVHDTHVQLQSSCDSPGAGIRLYSKSCYNDVTNCKTYKNDLAGIYSKAGSEYNYIDNNDVYENAVVSGNSFPGGIRMQCKNTNWWNVTNNRVWDNYGPGIFVGGQNCILYKNKVTGSKNCTPGGDGSRGDGIIIDRSDTAVGGTYNNLTSNTVCDNDGYDIYMQSGKVGNHGDENTCDRPSNWNDDGTTGCTYPCSPLEKPDLVITDKYETLDPVTGQFTVTYTVENQDSAGAGASTTSITDGTITLTNSVGTLAAGESHTGTAGPFNCPCGTTVTVTVCADMDNVVDESNETNNCMQNDLTCNPCLPDLDIIEKHEEWVDQALRTYNIIYTVKNIGTAAAPASTTTVRIDGSMAPPPDSVSALAIGAEHTGTIGPRTMSGDSDTITLYADKAHAGNGDVVESDETNNWIENTFSTAPKISVVAPGPCVDPGTFYVNINVTPNGNYIYGVQYKLTYNKDVIRLQMQNKGPFLERDGNATMVTNNVIDNINGEATYAITRKDTTDGITDPEGTFVVLTFTTVGSAGETSILNLSEIVISDPQALPIDSPVLINDSVEICAANQAPTAVAKSDHKYNNVGSMYACSATLNGSESFDLDNGIADWAWAFDDGQFGIGEIVDHVYSSYQWTGTAYTPFTATLTVTDNGGLSDDDDCIANVSIAGDANYDGTVNVLDASMTGLRWGKTCADYSGVCWGAEVMADKADLNNDRVVNVLDTSIVGLCWGDNA